MGSKSKYASEWEAVRKKKEEEEKANRTSNVSTSSSAGSKYASEWEAVRRDMFVSSLPDKLEELTNTRNELVTNYTSRFTDKDGNYIKAYRGDTKDALTSFETSKATLDKETKALLDSLATYEKYLDADKAKELRNYLTTYNSDLSGMYDTYKTDHDYWSQWADEDTYNRAMAYAKEQDAKKKKYASMTDEELEEEIKRLNPGVKEKTGNILEYITDIVKATRDEDKAKLVFEKNADNAVSKIADVLDGLGVGNAKDIAKLISSEGEYVPEKKDNGYDISLAKEEQLKRKYEKIDTSPEEVKALIERYTELERLNEQDDMAGLADRLSASFAGTISSFTEDKSIDKEMAEIKSKLDALDTNWKNLVAYNRIRRDEEANQYLKEGLEETAKDHPVLSSAASVVLSPTKALGNVGMLKDVLGDTDLPANPNSPWYVGNTLVNTLRETVMNEHDFHLNTGIETIDNIDVFDELYGTGMSTFDSVFNSLATGGTPIAGGALLGLSAASDTAQDIAAKGGNVEKAFLTGVVSGLNEMLWESVSLGRLDDVLTNGVKSRGFKGFIKETLKSMGINASEEFNTETANLLADYLINGGASTYAETVKNYLEAGYSEEEAKNSAGKAMLVQMAKAGVGGALQGLFMGGGSAALSTAATEIENKSNENKYYNQAGKDIIANAGVQTLADNAKEIPALRKLAEQVEGVKTEDLSKRGNKKYEHQVGKLYKGVQEAQFKNLTESEKTAFRKVLTAELEKMGVDDVNGTADILVKSMYDKKLTRAESQKIEAINGIDIVNKVWNSAEFTTEQENQVMENAEKVKENIFLPASYKGKTIIDATNEEVDSMVITSLEGDDITLSVKTGDKDQTVTASELKLNSDYEIVFEGLREINDEFGLDETTASNMLSLWEGYKGSAESFVRGIKSSFMYGQYNMRYDFDKSDVVQNLPERIRNQVYEMGREYKQKVTAEKEAYVKNKATTKASGKVTYAEGLHYEDLNESQKAQVDYGSWLAKTFGFDLEIFRSPKDASGNSLGESGWYSMGRGKMGLDVDAGTIKGVSFLLFTQGHELGHFIQDWSPAKCKVFADYLVETYGKDGASVDELVRVKIADSIFAAENDETGEREVLTYDEAFNEVVAESCVDFLADPNLRQRLLEVEKVDKGLAQKIKEFIKNILAKLEKAIEGLKGQSTIAAQVRGFDTESLQKLKDLWVDALKDSRENVLQARENDAKAQKNTTDEGDVKLMARSTKNGIVEYTPKEYNDFGWLAVSGILTGKELTKLYRQFADIKLNKYYNYKNKLGEYVIPVGDKYDSIDHIVYIKGTNKHPIIRQVVGFIDTISDEDRKNLTKDVLGDEYSKKFTDAFEIAEAYARKECFVRYMASDLPSYSVYRSRTRGQNSSGTSLDDGKRSNGKRNLSDSTEKVQNRDEVKLQDRSTDRNTDFYSRISEMQLEVGRLRRSMESIEASEEFKEEQRKLSEAFSKDVDTGIELYKEWLEKSEYSKLKNKKDALQEELDKLKTEYNNTLSAKALNEEEMAIAKSGLSEADYFRKQAVKEFGYTPYFYDAGYITPNGKMLNFSGEKGKHFGSRGQDHRAIGMIYAETEGTAALNRFIKDGNIRIMAESPGLDISTVVEPTKEQYSTIRKFISEYANKEFFNVDLTDESGKVIGSLEYEGHINSARVINDIKHFYATGEIREQSSVGKFLYSDRPIDSAINQSMTMEQAKTMIQKAFVLGGILEWYEGEYKNGDEWIRGVGTSEVALNIESEYTLMDKYFNDIQGYIDGDIYVEDVLDAYLEGTLVGKQAEKVKRLDVGKGYDVTDNRFYAPKKYSDIKSLWETANTKVTKANKSQINEARKSFLFAAHNMDVAKELNITPSEVNKKLRSWSNYSANAKDISTRLNNGVAESNQWSGIQNCSILSQISVTDEDISSMVKEIKGTSSEYQRNYIARTMLALNTHIDWSELIFDFKKGFVDENRRSVKGLYKDSERTITIGGSSYQNTVAHEMGHALDYKWQRDLFGEHAYNSALSNNHTRLDLIKGGEEAQQFYKNFRNFIKSLTDVTVNYSAYTMDAGETFARFVARFVEWVNLTANNNAFRETDFYGDKFTASQYIEFVKLLQEKAMLDAKKMSNDTLAEDVKFQDRIQHSQTVSAAVEKFGVTNDIERAGFVVPNGRMLNLSQYGLKGVRHKLIEAVYDDVKGDEAINRFLQEGNVRIKADAPGIEIGESVVPTISQINTMKKFINTSLAKNDVFYLDITDKNGNEVASVTYYADDVDVSDILYDIERYYENGKKPKNHIMYQDRNYAPTFYSQMGKVVDAVKQEKLGASSVIPMLKGKGVKNEEIKWSGIEEFLDGKKSVTKQELQEFIAGSMLQIEERELSGGATKWNQDYIVLPDGENYRELIFKMPDSSYTNYAMRGHWGNVEGILAHARIQDFIDSEGKKVLFVEEIQSDWHNEGNKQGYSIKLAPSENKKVVELLKAQETLVEQMREKYQNGDIDGAMFLAEQERQLYLERQKIEGNKGGVPDAPFHNNYHEYVLKRLLRMAAEEGYDSIGWTTADIQSERWSNEYAEGYRIEYDQDIPKFLNKYGKKWGAKVSTAYLPTVTEQRQDETDVTEVWSMDITDSMKESVLYEGQTLYQDRPYQPTLEDLGVDYKAENEKLKADVDRLREMHKLQGTVTHGKVLARASYEGVARKLLHNFGMKRVTDTDLVKEFVNKLDSFYSYIINEDDLIWDEMFDKSMEIAKWVDSKIPVPEQRVDYADEILKDIRSVKISLDDAQMAEVAYSYGSYNAFRKGNFGTIKLSNDGIKLDSQWSEWSNAYPWVFDTDTNSADMPVKLVEIIGDLRTTSAVTEEYDKTDKLRAMAMEIYDSYWNIPTVKTLADKHQQQVNALKNKHKTEMDELKEKKASELKDTKERYQDMVKKVRADKDAKFNAYKERVAEQKHKNVEGRNKTATKNKIKRVVKTLESLYGNPTKEKNVKIEFQDMVKKALIMADAIFDSGNISSSDILSGNITTTLSENDKKNLDAWRKVYETKKDYQQKLDALESSEKVNPKTHDELLKMISECNKRLNVLSKNLSEVVERQRADLNDSSVQDAIGSLVDAYKSLNESTEAYAKAAYNDYVAKRLDTLKESLKNTSIKTMTLTQLDEVYQAYKMVLTSVRTANEIFVKNKRVSVIEMGESVIREVKTVAKLSDDKIALLREPRTFMWENLKPVYAFERIGSETFMELFNEARRGEDVFGRDIADAMSFFREKSKAYDFNSWDLEETKDFVIADGRTFTINLEEIMSIYAYSKREQALDHITEGGFVFSDSELFTDKKQKGIKGKLKRQRTTVEAYRLDVGIFQKIVNSLTDEQKKFVEDMQEYLSAVMSAKGNEVSRVLYGIDLFKEKHYFPLKSSADFIPPTNQAAGEIALKNSGMTKATEPHADNPIVLQGFMDVWSGHVNKMSTYHAFVLPIENLNKVFNYTGYAQANHSVSVETVLKGAYGDAVTKYIENFITDLNGGVKVQNSFNVALRMISKFKKTAVAASASVVVQQPTAIVRALAMIDAKYFVHGSDGLKHNEAWEELKKYAPIAVIKEMGGFDISGGRQVSEYITAKEYKGKEVFKGLRKDSAYRDELLMKGAEKADEFGWITIWSAVKKEIADTTTHKVGSEEFLNACGERFTDIVTHTQVYDSVFSRSGYMRNKGEIAKMATSFMGEPTTSFNMLYNAVLQAKRGNIKKGKAVRIAAATMTSVVLAAVAKSFIYALRDDDDDESYAEKYAQALTNSLSEDIWIHNMLPYIRDVTSLLSGWDVERTDMALFKDVIDAFDDIDSSSKSAYRKAEDLLGAFAALFGFPAKNIMRTGREMYNMVTNILDDNTADIEGFGEAALDGLEESFYNSFIVDKVTGGYKGGNSASDVNKLLDKGKNAEAKKVIDKLVAEKVEQGKTEKEAKSSVKSSVTSYWKALYLQAYRDKDNAEMLRIRRILQATGLYDNVVETCSNWIKGMKDEEETEYTKW